jgi:glycosyltransferase involved in cell wall biosynthesis
LADEQHSEETRNILGAFHHWAGCRLLTHPLNNDYGAHKNFGNEHCVGDWIFQIDGDELPSEYLLGSNLHAIIEANKGVELIFVPRINDFKGVQPIHAQQWGWRLDESPSLKRPRVNWCDYQGRIYKNDPSRIKWDRKLHEKIIGHSRYSFLPAEEEYALIHDKTIEKQLETNKRYNQTFSESDNRGHTVV